MLSALVVVHNEEKILARCLEKLGFADEIVVVLDKCTDSSKEIALRYRAKILEGSWELEGPRRNQGIEFCHGDWILEVDADEHVSPELAQEVKELIRSTSYEIFDIPVHNYVGTKWIKHGWGGNFGKNAYPGLFKKGVKIWGNERIHPHLTVNGKQGPMLSYPIIHHIDNNITDMLNRFNRYTSARALDLVDKAEVKPSGKLIRKTFSRFFKCFIAREGYKEGGMGIIIALCAALYPLVANIKAATLKDS